VRILLDNCVPADLVPHIRGHEVETIVTMGWAGLDDGQLLDAMAGQFQALVTVDKSIPFQQLLANRPVAVVVLRAKTNRVGDLARLIPALLRALQDLVPGEVREVAG
jgi:predicted nuclease of predicted toxin-antitoxin system